MYLVNDMENKAFTAGVLPGGLTDDNQIRILVCYLISKRQNKLSGSDIIEILTEGGLANYFECASAISDLLERGHLEDVGFSVLGISETGMKIAESLASDVPLTVRERALAMADAMLTQKTNIGQHKVDIAAVDKGYNVKCTIADLGSPVFSLEIYAPTRETANLIKTRFIEYGAKIYSDALETLTEEK